MSRRYFQETSVLNRNMGLVFGVASAALLIAPGARAQEAAPVAPAPAQPTAPDNDAALKAMIGKPAPDFTLPDQSDKPHKLSAEKGKWVVLAFYPADKSSGCTLQNRSYSENLSKFAPLNAKVFTISTQDTKSKREFCLQDNLKHTLLADVGGKTASAYSVLRGQMARRVTFYIAPDGTISQIDTKPRVGTAGEDSLAALKRLAAPKEVHEPAR